MEVLIMSLMFYRGLTAGSRGWSKCECSMPGSSSFCQPECGCQSTGVGVAIIAAGYCPGLRVCVGEWMQ